MVPLIRRHKLGFRDDEHVCRVYTRPSATLSDARFVRIVMQWGIMRCCRFLVRLPQIATHMSTSYTSAVELRKLYRDDRGRYSSFLAMGYVHTNVRILHTVLPYFPINNAHYQNGVVYVILPSTSQIS